MTALQPSMNSTKIAIKVNRIFNSSNVLSHIFLKVKRLFFNYQKSQSTLRCETRGSNFFINSNVCVRIDSSSVLSKYA